MSGLCQAASPSWAAGGPWGWAGQQRSSSHARGVTPSRPPSCSSVRCWPRPAWAAQTYRSTSQSRIKVGHVLQNEVVMELRLLRKVQGSMKSAVWDAVKASLALWIDCGHSCAGSFVGKSGIGPVNGDLAWRDYCRPPRRHRCPTYPWVSAKLSLNITLMVTGNILCHCLSLGHRSDEDRERCIIARVKTDPELWSCAGLAGVRGVARGRRPQRLALCPQGRPLAAGRRCGGNAGARPTLPGHPCVPSFPMLVSSEFLQLLSHERRASAAKRMSAARSRLQRLCALLAAK